MKKYLFLFVAILLLSCCCGPKRQKVSVDVSTMTDTVDIFAQNCNKPLFLDNVVQDSLKTFIENYYYTRDTPYNAPTVYLVFVEQNSPNDTTISFMLSFGLVEEIPLDEETEPTLYIKGGCRQYGKTVVLFYRHFDDLPKLVDENLLILKRTDYDFFMSYNGPVYDICVRGVYNIYRYSAGKLELIRRIDTR